MKGALKEIISSQDLIENNRLCGIFLDSNLLYESYCNMPRLTGQKSYRNIQIPNIPNFEKVKSAALSRHTQWTLQPSLFIPNPSCV